MRRHNTRITCALTAALGFGFAALPALAQDTTSKIDGADTAWMISATGLVLMMTIPGLALFYCGMVRKKNVLATMAQSFACTAVCSLLWFAIGYSLSFVGDGPWLGTLERVFMRGISMEAASAFAPTIPEILYMFYQMTFAIITVALIAGAVADRMRFSAFLWFCASWLIFVYVPIAHWVWGGGFLANAGVLDFAGGTVVHLNAGIAGLVAAYVLGKRQGYGSDQHGSALGRLVGFQRRLGTRRQFARCVRNHRHPSRGLDRRADLDVPGMDHARETFGARPYLGCGRRSRHHHAGVRFRAALAWRHYRPGRWCLLLLGLYLAEAAHRIRRFARRIRRTWHRGRHRHAAHGCVRGGGTVREPRLARGIAGAAGGQPPTGVDPVLCRARSRHLVRRADLCPAQGDRVVPPAAGEQAARD